MVHITKVLGISRIELGQGLASHLRTVVFKLFTPTNQQKMSADWQLKTTPHWFLLIGI